MAQMDRRSFLARGSMMVAAVGAVAAVPGVADELVAGDTDVAAIEGEAGALTEPLVAHVRDLATGEIGVFTGTREVVLRDPGLASRLFQASR
jgi:tryptophan synthase beta subunit